MKIINIKKFFYGLLFVIVVGAAIFYWRDQKPYERKIESLTYQEIGLELIATGKDDFEYIQTQIRLCKDKTLVDTQCYEAIATLLTDQFDYKKAVKLLGETKSDNAIYSLCHGTMHFVGRISYEKVKSVSELYKEDRSDCNGGFYHGVMEQYFKVKNLDIYAKNIVETAKVINEACGNAQDFEVPLIYSACIHGTGHALMFVTYNDLPRSLDFCDTYTDKKTQAVCYGGVFMENGASVTSLDHKTKYLREGDRLYPCNWIENKYKSSCYEYHAAYFGVISDWDWAKISNLCSTVPFVHQKRCYSRMGGDLVDHYTNDEDIIGGCDLISNEEYQKRCVKGAAGGISGQNINNPQALIDFCEKLHKYEETCYSALGTNFVTWTKDLEKAKEFCKNIRDQINKEYCLGSVI